jgi:hypothetical protein
MDEYEDEYEERLKNGDRDTALRALRELLVDYMIHETGNANRCAKCQALQTRTSDIASIATKLMKLIDETGSATTEEVVDELSQLRNRNAGGSPPALPPPADRSPRSATRRSGNRRPSSNGGSVS